MKSEELSAIGVNRVQMLLRKAPHYKDEDGPFCDLFTLARHFQLPINKVLAWCDWRGSPRTSKSGGPYPVGGRRLPLPTRQIFGTLVVCMQGFADSLLHYNPEMSSGYAEELFLSACRKTAGRRVALVGCTGGGYTNVAQAAQRALLRRKQSLQTEAT